MSGAPKPITELVERFDRNVESYRAPTRLEREITYTGDPIDRLVYELYGLTDEEIRIVEEAAGEK